MATIDLGHNPEAQAAELNRQREGFDVHAHLKATKNALKWTDMSPEQQREFIAAARQQPIAQQSPAERESTRFAPSEVNLGLEDLRQLAQAAGFLLVAIGDKPPSDDGYAINREARIKDLEAQNGKLHTRATTAESTAAAAIRELNALKQATEEGDDIL